MAKTQTTDSETAENISTTESTEETMSPETAKSASENQTPAVPPTQDTQETATLPPSVNTLEDSIDQYLRSVSSTSISLKQKGDTAISSLLNDSSYSFENDFDGCIKSLNEIQTEKIRLETGISGLGDKNSQKKLLRKLHSKNSSMDSMIKNIQENQKKTTEIKSNNQTASEDIQDSVSKNTLAKSLLTEYQNMAHTYVTEGQIYPGDYYLEQSKNALGENLIKLKHLRSITKDKKKISADIAAPARIETLNDHYEQIHNYYKTTKDGLLPVMESYRDSNQLFDTEFSKYNQPLLSALKNYNDFLAADKEDEESSAATYMTTRKKEYFEAAQKAKKQLEENTKNWKQFLKKFSSQKSKNANFLSKNRKKQLEDFSQNISIFTNTAATADTKKKTLQEHTDSASKSDLAIAFGNSHKKTKQQAASLLKTYQNSDQKWKYEEDPKSIEEIVQHFQLFAASSIDASTSLSSALADTTLPEEKRTQLTELQNTLDEGTDTIHANYTAFQKKHTKLQKAHKIMKKFNSSSTKAPTLMRLVRHVKAVENGLPLKQNTLMQRFENLLGSAEEWVSDTIDKKTKGILPPAADIAWETASAHFDASDAVNSFKSTETQTSQFKFNKPEDTGDKISFGMQILSAIKSGYETFKEFIALITHFQSGGDRRELGKRLLSLGDSINGTFGSILSFFTEKIPILGTVQKALDIVLKGIDWFRSFESKSVMHEKKELLKQHIKEKNEQYQAEKRSDPSNAAASDVYDIDSEQNKKASKTYGFYSRQKTAAKAYAKTDELAGRVLNNYQTPQTPQTEQTKDHLLQNEEGTVSIASKRHELLLRKQEMKKEGTYTGDAKKQLKTQTRTLKALQDMNEVSIASEGKKRMRNKIHSDIENIIVDALGIIGDFAGTFGGAAGEITNLAISLASTAEGLIHSTASTARQFYRDKTNSFYSTENKKKRRSQMAETMYDRLLVLSTQVDNSGAINTETMTDALYLETSDHFKNLNEDLILGLDAYITHIINTSTKEEMIDSMSDAFSVEGN